MTDPIEEVIESIRQGKMVVVTDDEKRENEGDLVMAADKVTDEAINFMTKYGRGLICVAAARDRFERLRIKRMPPRGRGDTYSTAFMESIDAVDGVTTGISAHDRARTIQVLMNDESGTKDLVSPGHIFPLEAMQGGVLHRAGHTEASVDLAVLAGLKPGGVICEILHEDGTMARLPELREFVKEHDLKFTTIEDIIAYRRKKDKLVEFVREVNFPSHHGTFKLRLYKSLTDGEHHIALVAGEIGPDDEVLVRVHSECLTGDVLSSMRCDCGSQLHTAMDMVTKEGKGAVLYMRQEGRGIGLANKIHAYQLQEQGLDTVEANEALGFDADLRDYGVGAQILCDLGIHKLRLITNNPRKVVGLEGYGMKIIDRVPLICGATEHSERYLRTKKEKLGHIL